MIAFLAFCCWKPGVGLLFPRIYLTVIKIHTEVDNE